MFRTLSFLLIPAALLAQDHRSWRDYGGAADSAQFTALTQITKANVAKLEVAWTFPTGDTRR
jgi:quinoprotein glucose dehydrogenase